MMISEQPLVSIMCVTRNSAVTIERCVQSVLAQTYPRVQFVVQDGDSTDGTFEILDRLRHRLDLVSERDAGMADGFFKAMSRCKGEIIGSCWADEELFPDAVARAVEQFQLYPHAGAVIGAARNVDLISQTSYDIAPQEFDASRYLTRSYVPHFVASFFKRAALVEIGLLMKDFSREAFEMEIWTRLGLAFEIKTFPDLIGKYTIHAGQLSHQPKRMLKTLKARLAVLDRLFVQGGPLEGLQPFLAWLQSRHIDDDLHHLKSFVAQLPEENRNGLCEAQVELEALRGHVLRSLNVSRLTLRDAEGWPIQAYRRFAQATPWQVRNAIPSDLKKKVREIVECISARTTVQKERSDGTQMAFAFNLAMRLQERGDVDAAIRILHGLEYLKDARMDSVAMQVALKSPLHGNQELMNLSTRWAQRHALFPWIRLERPRRVQGSKLRLGYGGAFWSAEYMRYQLLPVLRSHDRERFEIIGISYSSNSLDTVCPDPELFDEWVDASACKGMEYVSRIRSLQLDILVDTTGFSQGHRFAELAQRCALIQISYINHNSTSGTPNVDYILADRNAAPEGLDPFFSEKIWRLPVPFFCFSYEGAAMPPIVDPPMFRKGSVTFGFFGSGPKLNLGVIEVWARLLNAVPNSILYIRNNELRLQGNRELLAAKFARFGISRDRVRLEGGLPWKLLLEEYKHVDISLDTWPYNGGNTISESLWQGVPVVTLRGATMSSRYGASMLLDLGWDGLVADSEDQYVECAIRLARTPELLRTMRHDLRRVSCAGGFRDTNRFAAALESAYCEMLERVDSPRQNECLVRLPVESLEKVVPRWDGN